MKFFTQGIVIQFLIVAPMIVHSTSSEGLQTSGLEFWAQSKKFYTSCLSESQLLGNDEDMAFFYQKLAIVDTELGQYSTAFDSIEKALSTYKMFESSTKNQLNIIDAHTLKGRLFGFLNNYPQAIAELFIVLEKNITIRGEDDVETARYYNHLGWHLERAAKIGVNLNDLTDLDADLSLLNTHLMGLSPLASLEHTPSEIFLLAKKCHEKALGTCQKIFGEIHPDVAKSYSLIGWVTGDLGKHDEALVFHQKSLQIRLKCHSKAHPDIARSYCNMGWNYEKLGDLTTALQFYTTALQMMQQVVPLDHPELVNIQNRLSRVKDSR